jgi:hypothetical protein
MLEVLEMTNFMERVSGITLTVQDLSDSLLMVSVKIKCKNMG